MDRDRSETLFKSWLVKSPPFQPSNSSRIFRRPQRFQPCWRRRYFVLSKEYTSPIRYRLAYYKDELQTKLKGEVDLLNATNITTHVIPPTYLLSKLQPKLMRAPAEQTPFFLLETLHKRHMRTYYFMPESQTQMERWVNCLSEACGLGEDDFLPGINPPADFTDSFNPVMPPNNANGFLTLQQNPQRQFMMMQQQMGVLSPSGPYPGFVDSASLRINDRGSPGRLPPQQQQQQQQFFMMGGQPSAGSPHFQTVDEYRVPPAGHGRAYSEDEYRIPPSAIGGGRALAAAAEDEYRVPPSSGSNAYTEDEYRVPPPARKNDSTVYSVESEYRLPPQASQANGQLAEDDYRLPPAVQPQPQAQAQAQSQPNADPDASQYINLSNTSTRVSIDRIQFFNNNNNNTTSVNSNSGSGAAKPPVPSRSSTGAGGGGGGGGGGGAAVDYINVTKLSPLSRVYSQRRADKSPLRVADAPPQPPPAPPASGDEPEPLLLPRRRSERSKSTKTATTDNAAVAASDSGSSVAESDDDAESSADSVEEKAGAIAELSLGGKVIDYAQIDVDGLHIAACKASRSGSSVVQNFTSQSIEGRVQYLEVDVRRTAAIAEMSVRYTM